jgi:hypothetical protein
MIPTTLSAQLHENPTSRKLEQVHLDYLHERQQLHTSKLEQIVASNDGSSHEDLPAIFRTPSAASLSDRP